MSIDYYARIACICYQLYVDYAIDYRFIVMKLSAKTDALFSICSSVGYQNHTLS